MHPALEHGDAADINPDRRIQSDGSSNVTTL